MNSDPNPNSMSRSPYSQVDAAAAAANDAVADDDEVKEYVDEDIVESVVNVVGVLLLFPEVLVNADVEDVDIEPLLLELCTDEAVNVPLIETDAEDSGTGTAAGGLVDDVAGGRIVNKSLLFSGSRADCEDKLSTELQLIERFESSSL